MAKSPKQTANQGFIGELKSGGQKDPNTKPEFDWKKNVTKQLTNTVVPKPQMNRQTSPKAGPSNLVKEQNKYIQNRQGKKS